MWPREANTTILYGVQYDWKRQTLPSYVKARLVQRYKHCRTILWRWVWLRLRGILPCRVVLNMTQRGKHCCLVWCWIRTRGKVRWKHVKRWWEGCLDVAGTNSDVTEIKEREKERERGEKKSRWAFVRISVSVLWAHVRPVGFCPPTQPDISKGNNWLIFCLDNKNPTFDCLLVFVLSCTLFQRYLSERTRLVL